MAREELDRLLGALLPFAHDQLQKRGEFVPVAASLDRDGKIALAMADGKDSNEMIAVFHQGFRQRRDTLRAVAVCYDVRVREDAVGAPEAIAVTLEHSDGEAVTVLEPYRRAGKGEFQYLPLTAERAQAQVFTAS